MQKLRKIYSYPAKRFKRMDFSLFIITLILVIVGLISLYSASAIYASNKESFNFDSFYFVKRQFVRIMLGLSLMIIISRINLDNIRNFIKPITGITIILLIITLLSPQKEHVRRWLTIGPISFQTSEFAKLAVILYLADYFDRNISKINTLISFIKPLSVLGLILVLIAFQPDLGTPIFIFFISMLMFYVAGVRFKYILIPFLAMIPFVIYGIFSYKYRLDRLKSFIESWIDISKSGYQMFQSLLAMGSGGWIGKGFGASKLKLLYLPTPHTDFIFPVIAEELGLLGSLSIVFLFFLFLERGVKIAKNAPSLYTCLLSLGITLMICIQAFFNIAMSIGLIPTKGITLPFFSYGGSSILVTLIGVGILLNISAYKNMNRL